jgi:uncharacterized protein YjbJ (UPF0337 family)
MDTKNSKQPEGFKIVGNWNTLSKQLKEKFSQLTDSDLKFQPGKENDLLRRMETKLDKKREDIIQLIKSLQPAKA